MSEPSSSFATNVLKLVTGSVFAQGLGVLVVPIVTRLFAPEAFGVVALFASITGTLGVVACLRYQLAIMLPKTDEDAANLLGVSLFSVLIITGLSILTIFFAGNHIARLLNSQELSNYLWLVPVAVFINGTFLALNYWNSRTKHFGRLSIARVVSSVATQTTKLGAGFAGFVSGGVLIGTSILGQLVATVVLGGQILRDDQRLFKADIRWKKMIAGLKRHKKFPIYSTWSALINTASHQLPVWFLAFYYSANVVGFYSVAIFVVSVPTRIVGDALAQVFYQEASNAYNQTGEMRNVVEKVFMRLVSCGIFPALLLMLVGKELFIIVLGTQWAEAGVYVQILTPFLFLQFISSPLSTILIVLERQGSYMIFDAILFGARLVALIGGGITGNILVTLTLFSLASALCYCFLGYWILLRAGVSVKHTLSNSARYVKYCIPMIVIMALVKWGLVLNPIFILVLASLAAIYYYITIFREDKILRDAAKRMFSLFRSKFAFTSGIDK